MDTGLPPPPTGIQDAKSTSQHASKLAPFRVKRRQLGQLPRGSNVCMFSQREGSPRTYSKVTRSLVCRSGEEGSRLQFKRRKLGDFSFLFCSCWQWLPLPWGAGTGGQWWGGKLGKQSLSGWGWQMIPSGCCLLILGQITPPPGLAPER